jgi:hypothetical protein
LAREGEFPSPAAVVSVIVFEVSEMARFGNCFKCEFGKDAPRHSHDVDPPTVCTLLRKVVWDGDPHEPQCRLTLAEQLEHEERIAALERNR